jgi:Calcineurin-like phosphoesterase
MRSLTPLSVRSLRDHLLTEVFSESMRPVSHRISMPIYPMHHRLFNCHLLLVLTVLLVYVQNAVSTTTSDTQPSVQILVVSDIHYCGTAGGQTDGSDTTTELLQYTLSAMHAAVPNPSLILIPGDLVAHTDGCPGGTPDRKLLFNKALNQITTSFRDVPVIIALGNNDTEKDDYQQTPQFLQDTASSVCDKLVAKAEQTDCDSSYRTTGSYSSLFGLRLVDGKVSKLGIVSVNTVPLSAKSPDNHWKIPDAPFLDKPTIPIIILGHIPPGQDLHKNEPFYGKEGKDFTTWLKEHSSRISFALFGHTHRNELHEVAWEVDSKLSIAQSAAHEKMLMLIAPSVSPVYHNNPGFLALTLNREMQIIDVKTYFLSLPRLKRLENGDPDLAWGFMPFFAGASESNPGQSFVLSAESAELLQKGLQSGKVAFSDFQLTRCNYAEDCDEAPAPDEKKLVDSILVQIP